MEGLPEPFPIMSEIIRQKISDRDARLADELRQLGPGWAIGYRLKCSDLRYVSDRQAVQAAEWEFHPVKLVDDALPVGLADFCYVTLKSWPETATN